jgi:hypothetical protein
MNAGHRSAISQIPAIDEGQTALKTFNRSEIQRTHRLSRGRMIAVRDRRRLRCLFVLAACNLVFRA